ncbi:hypothetical protein CARUB_v10006276mg [Capsella rubella]|uniref:Defensin-like protein n=1 Tax=Capsella rubella TaxID=81985 RepID=R0GX02_9BRAS|nr:hypothetical protein CARUB_v10006276mg [Capsella rubella]
MAKSPSLLLPIIFLVMFVLVEKSTVTGCLTFIGMCKRDIKDCSLSCKSEFGPTAGGLCDKGSNAGQCICTYPCPANKAHVVKNSSPKY